MNHLDKVENDVLNRPIFQSNELIEACKNMNTWCYRLFLLGTQAINPHITEEYNHDEDFPVTVIPYKTLMNLLDNPSGITNIKANLEKAYNGTIVIYTDTGGLKLRHIYEIMDYEPSIGLRIQFSKAMKPYLLNLVEKDYTSYLMKYTFSLTSSYGWKILELMFRYKGFIDKHGMKEIFRVFTIDELRQKLNIPSDLYSNRMDNFKKYIIIKPLDEINRKTIFSLRYDVLRKGRAIIGFKIYMQYKKGVKKPEEKNAPALPAPSVEEKPAPTPTPAPAPVLSPAPMSDRDELKQAMKGEGLKDGSINTWLKMYGVEGAAASWRLAVEHANKRTGVQTKGPARTAYLKRCMDNNIAYTNSIEAELKAEIESLKSVIRKNNETIQSLQKLNSWYEEQLKLRAKIRIPSCRSKGIQTG